MSRNDSREGPRQNPVHRVSEPASVSQRPQADVPRGGKFLINTQNPARQPRRPSPVLQTEAEIGHQKGTALPVKEHCFAVKGPCGKQPRPEGRSFSLTRLAAG